MKLKERLYLSPMARYRRFKAFPWDLVVSALLAVMTTCQVVLSVHEGYTYAYSQMMLWNRLFFNPDAGQTDPSIAQQYSLHSQSELVKYVRDVVETYYELNEYTLADYNVRWNNGEKAHPVLSSHYFHYESRENRMIFPAEYRLSRSDLGPFSDSMLGDYLRAVDFFEISFRIQQQFYNHSDVPESCYDWVIKLQFDYSYHSSVIATQVLTPYVCGGLDGFTRHYLWIDVFVGVSALCSLLNLWKDFTTRMRLTSTLQSLGSWQALRLSEKLKFFSVPTLITMLGNYTQILTALIALASTESSNETYHTLVGIGCFCALITVTSYYDHTSSSYLLINTLKRSAGDLLMYIFGLTPILLAFTGLGMCWFYPTGFFLTIVDTWATLLCLTLGDSVAFFFGLAMGVDLFFAQVYMYSFIVLFICGVQIIFLTYIRAAFHSFRRNPVSLLDDDSAYREQRLSSDGLVQLPAQISAIRKLERMRSSRTFKHLISNGLQVMPVSPQDELEETTIELLREMDETAKQLTVLMIDLKDKAVENKEDELAVSRFRELVGSEIQGLCRETVERLA